MAPEIEIDEDLFELLKQHAEPFVDTPNTVLRRLLLPEVPPNAQREPDKVQPPRKKTASTRGRKGQRAQRGTLLPETEYELPILRYLAEHDGRAPSREVVDAVGESLKDRLTEADLETLKSGDVRWKSRVAFSRLRLVEQGEIDSNAPRGTWQITDAGRTRVKAEASR